MWYLALTKKKKGSARSYSKADIVGKPFPFVKTGQPFFSLLKIVNYNVFYTQNLKRYVAWTALS